MNTELSFISFLNSSPEIRSYSRVIFAVVFLTMAYFLLLNRSDIRDNDPNGTFFLKYILAMVLGGFGIFVEYKLFGN
jgi:hypothetical protein